MQKIVTEEVETNLIFTTTKSKVEKRVDIKVGSIVNSDTEKVVFTDKEGTCKDKKDGDLEF